MRLWEVWALCAGCMGLTAFGAWVAHLLLDNAGVVDIVWGANLALASLLGAALGPGWAPRRWVLAGLVCLTGGRLTWHIARRTLGHPEEGRYAALREQWGGNIRVKFLLFFLAQALLGSLLALPFLVMDANPTPSFRPPEWGAGLVFLAAWLLESLADSQLAAFKARPDSRGRTCRTGLWRFSRHPNYFFEWLQWLAYWIAACAAPWGWTTAFAPALMLHFLLNVTGVRLTEEQCLRSRGEDYARYQRETSAFVPWPPKAPKADVP